MKNQNKVSSKEIKDIKKILTTARNKYENKLLEIERLWAKLGPHDYEKRRLILDLTNSLLEIDKSIKQWEDKLK